MRKFLIYWSPAAEDSYLKTISFILKNWTIKEAEEFIEKVDDLLSKISIHHKLCPPSKLHKDIRKCVISPQTSLIYRLYDDVIEIIALIDNRSLPYY